jgi:hypothetical protein
MAKPHLKHVNTYKTLEGGTRESHSRDTRTTPFAVLTENRRIDMIYHEPFCRPHQHRRGMTCPKEEGKCLSKRMSKTKVAHPSLLACGECSYCRPTPPTSTSKSKAPKREHDTIAPPSPIQRNKSGVSPRGCWEGTWRILHWRLQQGHDARRRHRQQLWHSQSAAFAGILTPKPGKPVSVISQNFPNFGMLK